MAEAKSSDLKMRLLSAAIMVPLAILIVYTGGWVFAALLILAGAIMAHEWLAMTVPVVEDRRKLIPVVYVGVAGGVVVYQIGGFWPAWNFLVIAIALCFLLFFMGRMNSARWAAVGILWLGLPLIAMAWLRQEASEPFLTVFWLVLTVSLCDSGAYFAGRAIGGPKLAPRLSPKKTWAGLVGGMATAGVAGAIVAAVTGAAGIILLAGLSAAIAALSQVGDLAESAVKRYFNVKDSGSIIPGHGGVLDRVDGLLITAPVILALAATRHGGIFPWH